MRFVDLFCGIGGFHAALSRLGHQCVFACDVDNFAAEVYERNWGQPGGFPVCNDIRKVIDRIPPMDMICAGFPCQPFSKSGAQAGFLDHTRGTLFSEICKLADKHRPAFILLENVPNIVSHDDGNTFRVIQSSLEQIGYNFYHKILSPHNYGTCQIRKRIYIVCIRGDLVEDFEFKFPEETQSNLDVRTILDENVDPKYSMTDDEIYWVNMWEDFLKNVNLESKLPGHPIWAECFQRTEEIPGDLTKYTKEQLQEIAKQWGGYYWSKDVNHKMTKKEIIEAINLQPWKQNFVKNNRDLYAKNKEFIDKWLEEWKVLEFDEENKPYIPKSRRKYEWQAGSESRTNWENLIQFRPSGIRIKRADYFPTLVAISQIPIVGWLKRKITPKECARIQDFDVDGKYGGHFVLGESDKQSYKQLGNAVSVKMVYLIQKSIDQLNLLD